ncbi:MULTISPECIES: DUF998 domain-containing protein [Pseudonocardia]|uniref:DUF998 domain-containing protein n=2 Tax=Pseudonocardia TaxID=1847 RepID=A0A1Y2MLI6_PSEAH|nr:MULTISPECIES: DUF998 domain-containing protein [Pseudonocardia]OSY35849.1 hypothetical protein BG845_05812 [Pseudonocardia autotrophica]TDN73141.1 uncharacterized protein DUF998 [Pseudonocardia autotrophica]BBG03862.1 hypothetical protein Pdca_50710 [Pseudonocardia autotrophica]GEC27339.1 hypothetical protein PSA01_43680 [Pseudonocardia saturnea]
MSSYSIGREPGPLMSRGDVRTRIGLVLLALQVLYLPLELFVVSTVRVPYSLVENTISELGAVTCAEYVHPGGVLAVCSPWHAVMNGAFVIFGVLMIAGVVLARPVLRAGRLGAVAVGLWIVTGLGSIGTGLVPLDVSVDLHLLVSNPVAVAQPVALFVTAPALPRPNPVGVTSGIGLALVAAVATVVFLGGGLPEMSGLLERLVLWPATLWLGAVALLLLCSDTSRPESSARSAGVT